MSIPLDAGTYWVSVQPILEYGIAGQSGITSSYLGNLNGIQGNPGGGFALPDNQQALEMPDGTPVSGAYRVIGIPEPASLLLLGLGVLLFRRR